MRTLCVVVLVFAAGCNFGGSNTPRFGRWKVTEITGKVTYVDSGAACVGSYTFNMPDLMNARNGVRVNGGALEYTFSFKGVAGSPAPDGYDLAGTAAAMSGTINGTDNREDLHAVSTAMGGYDDSKMNVNWTLEQHLGMASACKTDISGSGTFAATPP